MVRPASADIPVSQSVFSQPSASVAGSQGHGPKHFQLYGPRHSKNGPCRTLSSDEVRAINIRRQIDELAKTNPWLGEKSMSPGYWESRENRVAAIGVLVEIVTKIEERPMESICQDDFEARNLGWMLRRYYHSWFEALEDAGFRIECPWLGKRVPTNYWQDKSNRIKATQWLVAKCAGETRSLIEILYTDFTGNRLHGLLDFYNGSPFTAFLEAGLVTEDDRVLFNTKRNDQRASALRAANESRRRQYPLIANQ